jgi:hypothetical protein
MFRNFINGVSIFRLNGYSVFILLFTFLILFANPIFSQPVQISINKIPQKLNYYKFGNCFYLNLKDLSNLLIADSSKIIINSSIQYNNEILKFSSNSFFLVYQNDTLIRVAQMAQPALEKNDELYIPVISFFNAMNGTNLINTFIESKNIEIIELLIFKNKFSNKNENLTVDLKQEGRLIQNSEPNKLIEKYLMKIEKPLISNNEVLIRGILKNNEITNIDKKYSDFNFKSKIKDSLNTINQGKEIFLYDTRKDEINPKSYTIPKDLKKPK